MMKPIYANELTESEREAIRSELKSESMIVVKRSQMILLSAEDGLAAQAIAERVGYSAEMVRLVIQAFNQTGLSALYPQKRGRQDDQRAFDDEAREHLQALVRRNPREFGHESSLWTLTLLAEVSYTEGLTDRVVHPDTVNETLSQMGITWKKAKRHLQSPDEQYVSKKNDAIG